MFDAKTIGSVIGQQAFDEINASNMPKIETMTLLHIWTQSPGSQRKLREMAETGTLLAVLKKEYRQGLEKACDTRINNGHLTQTECLQAAGLPLEI